MSCLIAIETSTEAGSVAFWRDGALLGRACPAGRPHSETLLPLISDLLAEAGATFADLDGIAFGAGPGSFTGLRVACGVAQGLAVAADLPVVPVGTLEAMAWESGGDRVAVYLDARMNEVYCGFYVRGVDGVASVGTVGVHPPLGAPLPGDDAWIACGNGLAAYPLLAERVATVVADLRPGILPTATAVAALAAPRLLRGEGIDAARAAPIYVRDKVAFTVAERLAQGGKA